MEWWPASPGQEARGFVTVFPLLGVDRGEELAFLVGAPLRLSPPGWGATGSSGGLLRREDWDEPSDWGHWLRELWWSAPGGWLRARAGLFSAEGLGFRHLVGRLAHGLTPDYHPAGAKLSLSVSAVDVEVLASDMLGARLFAGGVTLDVSRLLGQDEARAGRVRAGLSAAHDFGRAGGVSPPLTLTAADVDVTLHASERHQVLLLLGTGARLEAGARARDLGALLGVVAAAEVGATRVQARLEARRHGGRFRFGLFGADYELARFSATGLAGPPLAEERLARGLSGLAELVLSEARLGALSLAVSAAVEHFAWGRTDADAVLSLISDGGASSLQVRAIATGLGGGPRYSAQATVSQRLRGTVHAWAGGGTLHFPRSGGGLTRGWSASAGLGVGR
jgi:hypothetical protein